MSATVDDIIANAHRLREDALLLAEHGRYQTAVAIAVLSIEEAAKAMMTSWMEDDPTDPAFHPNVLRSHSEKQRVLAVLVTVIYTFDAMELFIDKKLHAMSDFVINDDNADIDWGDSWTKWVKSPELHAFIREHLTAGKISEIIFYERGGLDALKKHGFYADIPTAILPEGIEKEYIIALCEFSNKMSAAAKTTGLSTRAHIQLFKSGGIILDSKTAQVFRRRFNNQQTISPLVPQ